MDYVRHTGDAKSTLYELQTAQSELQASSNLFLKPRRDALRQILKRGQERKELHPELDPDLAIDCLYGPMLYHMLNPYAPLDRKFARALVKQLFKGFRPA